MTSMSRICCIAAGVLALSSVVLAPSGRSGHDYIQFHAAATLLRARENPYAFSTQMRAQHGLRAADAPAPPIQPTLTTRSAFSPIFTRRGSHSLAFL